MFWNILLMAGTFFLMEGVAWATHKYVMHGFLWTWHESHHRPHKGFFERNDLFALVFSIPAVVLTVIGFEVPALAFCKWIGFGVTAYGIFYVVFTILSCIAASKLNLLPKVLI